MTRAAALLILLSQVILLGLVQDPTGERAILFSFLGTPILALGLLLALVSLMRRRKREGSAEHRGGAPGSGTPA